MRLKLIELEMLFGRYCPGIEAKSVGNWTLDELEVRLHFLESFLANERKL